MERARRIHALTGIVPLPLFLLVHGFEVSAAPYGREAFSARVLGAGSPRIAMVVEAAFVVFPLAVHIALGIRLFLASRKADAGKSPAMLPVVRVTGVLAAFFVVFHLSHTWALKLESEYTVAIAYEVLRQSLGLPLVMLIYAAGIASAIFHVAFAIPIGLERVGVVMTPLLVRRLRGMLAAFAIVGFFVFMNAMSHFAVGRALFFGGVPEAAEAGPPGE